MRKKIKERIEKIRNGEVPEGYKEIKKSIIPTSWDHRKFGEVMSCFSGGTPKTSNDEYYKGDIPYIRSSDLNQLAIYNTNSYINKEALEASSAKIVEKGTLLLAIYGATAGVVSITEITGAINQAILAIFPNELSERDYLFHYLKFYKNYIVNKYTQGGQPNLSAKVVKETKMNLPPLGEQKKIAYILTTWDKAIEMKQQLLEKKKQLKKGLMQRLLTGELRLPGFDDDWKKYKLDELLHYEQPNKYLEKEYVDLQSSVHCLPVLTANKGFIKGYTKNYDNYYDNLPAIIFDDFTTDNKFVDFKFKVESSAIKILQPIESKADLKFVYEKLQLIKFRVGPHKRHYISEYRFLTIKTPPLKEQKAIAEVLSTADKSIELVEKQIENLKLQKKGLMQLLLTGIVRVNELDIKVN